MGTVRFRSHGLTILALAVLFISHDIANAGVHHNVDVEDNEFAEFEDFEEADEPVMQQSKLPNDEGPEETQTDKPASAEDEDEATVEVEDNEFEHIDEDEYEGYDKESSSSKPDLKPGEGPKITFAQLPAHLRYLTNKAINLLLWFH